MIVGGFIPPEDVSFLLSKGVRKVFGPGSKMEDIVNHVKELAAENVQCNTKA